MRIKIILGTFFIALLSGCAQTAFLGPIYSLASTGSVYHAGLSYGSDKAITTLTGKSPGENIKDLIVIKKEDSEFNKLVKRQIKKTREQLNLTK
jgi:hypothetical protein